MKKLLLIIPLLLLSAVIIKPSEASFEAYVKAQLNGGEKYRFLTRIVNEVSNGNFSLQSNYYNRVLYSVGETIVGNEKHEFLGIGGFWFFLD